MAEYKPVSTSTDDLGEALTHSGSHSRGTSVDIEPLPHELLSNERPPYSRTGSYQRSTARSHFQAAPTYSRSSSYHHLRPATGDEKQIAKRKRYIYAGIALLVALTSFVIQTETAGYLANTLDYKKPIFCLYLTHSSWGLMWPLQLVFLRFRKLNHPFSTFFQRHIESTYQTASVVVSSQSSNPLQSPVRYILKVCAILVIALNIAGCSWYIAVNYTTPDDLTAIYNCQAFFAYAFSVPILKEPFRYDKAFAVLLSIVGVVIVAYAGSSNRSTAEEYPYRALGNLVIGIGAILYGLYEVLYKRMASPPPTVNAKKQTAFANVVGSILGFYTFSCLWIALPILHYTGLEKFELPSAKAAGVLSVSIFTNMTFSGSFLILMTLTSPVLSSVASLLTTFLVPLVDWLLFGTEISGGDLLGGVIIIVAFTLLSWASYKELQEENTDNEVESDDEDEDTEPLHRE